MEELIKQSFIQPDLGKRIEMNVKKQQQIESTLEGKIRAQNGQKIFEIREEQSENGVYIEVKEAEYRRDTVVIGASKKESEKLIAKEGCVYIPALNKRTAEDKYIRNKDQKHYFAKAPILSFSDITF
jgi:hypothetical protein